MRIVNYPAYSNPHSMSSDSIWNIQRTLTTDDVENNPDNFWYLIIPNPIRRRDIVNGSLYYWKIPGKQRDKLTHPRIKLITYPHAIRQREEMRFICSDFYEQFNFMKPGYHYDCLITGKVVIGAMMWAQTQPWNSSRGDGSFLFCTRNYYLFDDESATGISDVVKLAQCVSWMVGVNVFASHDQLERAKTMMREFLQPTLIQKVLDRSTIIYPGFDCDELVEIIKGVEKHQKFSVCWSHRLHGQYHFMEGFEILNQLFITNGVPIYVQSPSAKYRPKSMGKEEWESKYSHFDLKVPCQREEYLRRAAACQVALSLGRHGDGGLSDCEMLYAGTIVVMRRAPWNQYMLPDWPYKVDSNEDAYKMLVWMKDHWQDDEVQDAMKKVRAHIRATFNSRVNNRVFMDWLKARHQERIDRIKRDRWVEVLEQTRDQVKFPISYTDFSRKLTEAMEAPYDFEKEQSRYPQNEINRGEWMSRLALAGMYDDCQDEYPIIRRIGDQK